MHNCLAEYDFACIHGGQQEHRIYWQDINTCHLYHIINVNYLIQTLHLRNPTYNSCNTQRLTRIFTKMSAKKQNDWTECSKCQRHFPKKTLNGHQNTCIQREYTHLDSTGMVTLQSGFIDRGVLFGKLLRTASMKSKFISSGCLTTPADGLKGLCHIKWAHKKSFPIFQQYHAYIILAFIG